MDAFLKFIGQLLNLTPEHIVLLLGLGSLIGVVLGFLAPRFWDLFKKRFERRLERSPLEREFPEPSDRQYLEHLL
jgi:hypothetical protein